MKTRLFQKHKGLNPQPPKLGAFHSPLRRPLRHFIPKRTN